MLPYYGRAFRVWTFFTTSLKCTQIVNEAEYALSVARLGFCLCLREVGLRRTRAWAFQEWRQMVTFIDVNWAIEKERLRTSQVVQMLEGARKQLTLRSRLPLTVEEELSGAKTALQQELLISKQVFPCSRLTSRLLLAIDGQSNPFRCRCR